MCVCARARLVVCVYIYMYGLPWQLSWLRIRLPVQMWVQSLGREDSLEEETATHPSVLTWEIPWTEEPGGLQSMGSQRVGQDLDTKQEEPGMKCYSDK